METSTTHSRQKPGTIRMVLSSSAGLLLLLSLLMAGACEEGPDTDAPDQVTGVSVTVGDGSIIVSWNASTAGDLSHYLLYLGTSSSDLSSTGENITATSDTLTDLTEGTTYYFYVTAVDEAGNESAPSSTVEGRATSVSYEVDQGWSEFESESYETAITNFNNALELDADYADASSGLGWSHAMLGSLSDAATALQNADSWGLTTLDAHAGLAVVYRDLPDLESAISHADTVVTDSPSYVFSHRTSIDYKDMHLVMAQCHYRQGEAGFSDAQAQVDILDPDNGLDPATPSTWVVGGVTYQTYAEALLMEIESLEASIGG